MWIFRFRCPSFRDSRVNQILLVRPHLRSNIIEVSSGVMRASDSDILAGRLSRRSYPTPGPLPVEVVSVLMDRLTIIAILENVNAIR